MMIIILKRMWNEEVAAQFNALIPEFFYGGTKEDHEEPQMW
jgi:hypothetical protein